jgi:hypothetical protein
MKKILCKSLKNQTFAPEYNRRKTPNQLIKTKFIRFPVVALFLMIKKPSKNQTVALEPPELFR